MAEEDNGAQPPALPANAPTPLPPSRQLSIAPPSPPAGELPPSSQIALPAAAGAADPQGAVINEIMGTARTVAVVGASEKAGKPSHRVSFYLMRAGFEVYPVNPSFPELGGRKAYPDLRSIPVKIDVVDIFRKAEMVPPVVEEAISIGAGAVWMQEGIADEKAASRARAAGLKVVMDRCMMKEHRKMLSLPPEGQ